LAAARRSLQKAGKEPTGAPKGPAQGRGEVNGGIHLMQGFVVDLRQSIRGFSREPGFTAVAVLALAIGVGAARPCSASSSRPRAPAAVRCAGAAAGGPFRGWSRPARAHGRGRILPARERKQGPWRLSARCIHTRPLPRRDLFPRQVRVANVSASMFGTLASRRRSAAAFEPAEDFAGGQPVAIVSDGFWRRELGADPAALGANGVGGLQASSGVGVLPSDAALPWNERSELFLPLAITPEQAAMSTARSGLYGVARLRPGIAAASAKAEMQSIVHATSGLWRHGRAPAAISHWGSGARAAGIVRGRGVLARHRLRQRGPCCSWCAALRALAIWAVRVALAGVMAGWRCSRLPKECCSQLPVARSVSSSPRTPSMDWSFSRRPVSAAA